MTSSTEKNKHLLSVRNLHVEYHTDDGRIRAVSGVSFNLKQGEKLGLVGESGCGKSTTVFALMRLIKPPARIVSGEVILDNRNILDLSDEEMRESRLSEIALIPQGAMNSLNPVLRVKTQITDGMKAHKIDLSQSKSDARVSDLLDWVGLDPKVSTMYPHELSGGMKQRVAIAIAISLRPKLIIADEPTSALDVVVQKQILETLDNVQKDLGSAMILVGHDMGIMAQFVDTVGVMYAGKLVETSPVESLFEDPLHPYTKLLISSIPGLEQKDEFTGIPGITPSLLDPPTGCMFHPRCPSAFEGCDIDSPINTTVQSVRKVACHLFNKQKEEKSIPAGTGIHE